MRQYYIKHHIIHLRKTILLCPKLIISHLYDYGENDSLNVFENVPLVIQIIWTLTQNITDSL